MLEDRAPHQTSEDAPYEITTVEKNKECALDREAKILFNKIRTRPHRNSSKYHTCVYIPWSWSPWSTAFLLIHYSRLGAQSDTNQGCCLCDQGSL
jgi:hypothetical protein